jgi:hypothetical protein
MAHGSAAIFPVLGEAIWETKSKLRYARHNLMCQLTCGSVSEGTLTTLS